MPNGLSVLANRMRGIVVSCYVATAVAIAASLSGYGCLFPLDYFEFLN